MHVKEIRSKKAGLPASLCRGAKSRLLRASGDPKLVTLKGQGKSSHSPVYSQGLPPGLWLFLALQLRDGSIKQPDRSNVHKAVAADASRPC